MSRSSEIDLEKDIAVTAARMKAVAASGLFEGDAHSIPQMLYMRRCTVSHEASGTKLIFTRDSGHHSSGWMKNPDYERCLHLSMSALEAQPSVILLRPSPPVPRAQTPRVKELWLRAFFGEDLRLVWAESPKSAHGQRLNVWHWRLFCDARWKPFHPRKEVYSMDFTDLGWRTASQVLEEDGIMVESVLTPG